MDRSESECGYHEVLDDPVRRRVTAVAVHIYLRIERKRSGIEYCALVEFKDSAIWSSTFICLCVGVKSMKIVIHMWYEKGTRKKTNSRSKLT